ncbi:MAG: TIGR02302 family protein [Rhodospirillales bacterium]|jgi:uncharacterized protein (TIGR02302 family)|nr:TIGR02302 family protein [Rhodospirillales bacterium]
MTGSPWRLRILLALAGAAVLWERLWPRLWPVTAILGAFTAIALLDVLPRLPSWLHAGVLVMTALALASALWSARGALRRVGPAAARRRLEQDSGLADRPLRACDDRLAGGVDDSLAEALWQRHRQQMAAQLRRLRLHWPRSDIDRAEPWGFRAGTLLLLVVGLAAGWHEPMERLARAVDPGLRIAAGPAPVIEVWISPPPYTRAAPVFLSGEAGAGPADGEIMVPRGSTVLARVTGVAREPELKLGVTHAPFTALDDQGIRGRTFGAEVEAQSGDQLAVLSGRQVLAAWPIRVLGDQPPRIALTAPPAESGNGGVALAYETSDDYGVRSALAVLRRTETNGAGGEIRIELPLTTSDPTVFSGESREDLSAHRWAGENVEMELLAEDDMGQTGSSGVVSFILPERRFEHAVARAIVAARKRLLTDDAVTRHIVAGELRTIAAHPDAFAGDTVVSLALAVADKRLLLDRDESAVDSVRDLLWATALRIDAGEVPAAERALTEARQRLREALDNNEPASEIERRMDELQAAMDRYLQALAAEMARQGEANPAFDPRLMPAPATDLNEMLETARQLLRTGARDSAEQMLAQLQRMLDQLRAGMPMAGPSPAMKEASELLDALGQMRDRQQSLLDETFQRLRTQRDRPESGGRGQPRANEKSGDGAEAQQQLRRELTELMARAQRMLGSAPGALPGELPDAEQAMRSAGRALEQNRLGEGANRQGQAVDALDRAIDAMAEALGKALGMGNAVFFGPGAQPGGAQGDAFGRNPPGGQRGAAIGGAPIPDAASLRRAQQILEELRRRAGDQGRPTVERDYIERMLRRY